MPIKYLPPARGTDTGMAALPHSPENGQLDPESVWPVLSESDSVQSLPQSDDAACAQNMLVRWTQDVLLLLATEFLGPEFGRHLFPVIVAEACVGRSVP